MAGRLTTTEAHIILNNRFGLVAVTTVATYHVGLSKTAPAVDGTGVTEPVGGGYARVPFTNNTANWPAAANRTKSNGAAVVFATATADWGTITHFVLYDAASGGTLRAYGPLDTPQAVVTGETRSFPIGSLIISMPSS